MIYKHFLPYYILYVYTFCVKVQKTFPFVDGSFCYVEVSWFDLIPWFILIFVAFAVICKKSLPRQRSNSFSPMFSSSIFYSSILKLKSIWVNFCGWCMGPFSLFYKWIFGFPNHVYWRDYLSSIEFRDPLSNTSLLYMHSFISGLLILFHFFMWLFLCILEHTLLITITL